jgi:hypothetical protein
VKILRDELPDFPHAACRNADPEIFHGDDKRDKEPDPLAAKMCARCVHGFECLKWALDHKESGTWGGTTVYQRAALLRVRHRVRCPGCGGYDIYEDRQCEICVSCGLSWQV